MENILKRFLVSAFIGYSYFLRKITILFFFNVLNFLGKPSVVKNSNNILNLIFNFGGYFLYGKPKIDSFNDVTLFDIKTRQK